MAGLRYRRHQRLQSRDVSAVLASGRRRRASAVSVQVRPNGLADARLGLIVPKRHLPRAVDRNRMKRLLREWFRSRQHAFAGSDLLVRVTSSVERFELLIADLDRLFESPP